MSKLSPRAAAWLVAALIASAWGCTRPAASRAAVPAEQLRASLVSQLLPGQPSFHSLLRSGGYTSSFNALEAGSLTVKWYFHTLPPGGRVEARQARAVLIPEILIAAGQQTFSGPGQSVVKLALTAHGKMLLKHAKRIKLTAEGTFTPSGETPVYAEQPFVIRTK